MRPFFIAFAASAIATVAVLAVTWVAPQVRRAEESAMLGWRPVQVLAAAHNFEPGHTLTSGDVEAIELPERFVTASNARPGDTSTLVGRTLTLPVLKGDALTFSQVADLSYFNRLAQCVEAIEPEVQRAAIELTHGDQVDLERGRAVHDRCAVVARQQARAWFAQRRE